MIGFAPLLPSVGLWAVNAGLRTVLDCPRLKFSPCFLLYQLLKLCSFSQLVTLNESLPLLFLVNFLRNKNQVRIKFVPCNSKQVYGVMYALFEEKR